MRISTLNTNTHTRANMRNTRHLGKIFFFSYVHYLSSFTCLHAWKSSQTGADCLSAVIISQTVSFLLFLQIILPVILGFLMNYRSKLGLFPFVVVIQDLSMIAIQIKLLPTTALWAGGNKSAYFVKQLSSSLFEQCQSGTGIFFFLRNPLAYRGRYDACAVMYTMVSDRSIS